MHRNPWLRISLCAFVLLIISTAAAGQVAISVTFGPPPLPVYEQPLCPGEGYIWVPGYWAWDDGYEDYYWVPGTWVLAPEIGYLWTPPWWGWDNGVFIFHEGWWGPVVGFYGGIVYGFGYFGEGYVGGRWEGDRFFYNRSVTNVNVVNIRNVYNENVTVRNENHVSFNGGPGGIQAHPRPEEEAAARQRHIAPVAAQTQHLRAARGNPELRATANQGKPPVAATVRPGELRGGRAVPARQAGGEYRPPANRGAANRNAATRAPQNRGGAPIHPNDLPPIERSQHPNTGNSKQDQKYQQQQEKLLNRQNQERQRLQQRQDQEHQRTQANANPPRQQQMEQRHQQQTQQLRQRHVEQQQKLERRYRQK